MPTILFKASRTELQSLAFGATITVSALLLPKKLERTRSVTARRIRAQHISSPPIITSMHITPATVQAVSAVRNHPLMTVKTPEMR